MTFSPKGLTLRPCNFRQTFVFLKDHEWFISKSVGVIVGHPYTGPKRPSHKQPHGPETGFEEIWSGKTGSAKGH